MKQNLLARTDGGHDEIQLVLSRLTDLFNAPLLDPLSRSPAEAAGISGVEYLLGQLQVRAGRTRPELLVLCLPPDASTSGDASAVYEALHRYTEMRISNELNAMRATRRYGLRILGLALLMLALLLALSALFASDFTAWIPAVLRRPLEYGFEIVGWVMMWHPIEVLVFNPMSHRSKLRALRGLARMKVVLCSHVEHWGTAEPTSGG